MHAFVAMDVAPRQGVPRRDRTSAKPGLLPTSASFDRAASRKASAWISPLPCGEGPGLRGLLFGPNAAVPSRRDSACPKTPASDPSPEKVPSKSVFLTNAKSFLGCKASVWPRNFLFSAGRRLFGRKKFFRWSESVVLPGARTFLPQTASFWPAREVFLAGRRPFGRRKNFSCPESVRLPKEFSFLGQKASFWRKFLPGCPNIARFHAGRRSFHHLTPKTKT